MTWTDTVLWRQLSTIAAQTDHAHHASAVHLTRALLNSMPEIEQVLKSGGTAGTSDFTLHDEEHSFRVAGTIVEIATESVLQQLAPTEMALLLMAAYLHDIGMTPQKGKVQSHRDFLLDGNTSNLSATEREEFQRWLDDFAGGIEPPLAGRIDIEIIRRADELITYYARARHNDWSEEWIRANLNTSDRRLYDGSLDDLILLCKSHHYGYDELIEGSFDPKLGGRSSPPEVIHLRFLAALLRVADILEFDPERTPDVILKHRSVAPKSLIYWYKDHEVKLLRQGSRLIFQARPSRALVQRAVLTMADDIDRELDVCWRLRNENRFSAGPVLGPDTPIPHTWSLEQSLTRSIEPKPNTYEYIEGSFRPNTNRLLELLSGLALYKTPFAAVRELLQNAFDAVREKIAYQRLNQSNPADERIAAALASLNSVRLELSEVDGRVVLACTDTGVGMTKDVLTNQFLVSGSERKHQVLALERRAQNAGFPVGRTGQFGIGALSYFMLADQVTITTRRSAEPKDMEPNGWLFVTDGIGSFGELRRTDCDFGTTVTLAIKPSLYTSPQQFFTDLADYIQRNLISVPCNFDLRYKEHEITNAPGWTRDGKALTREAFSKLEQERSSSYFAPADPLELARKQSVLTSLGLQSRWHLNDGCTPDGAAHFRVGIPHILTRHGASVIHAVFEFDDHETRLKSDAYLPEPVRALAWKGMAVSGDARSCIEMDWHGGAVQIAIDRGSLIFEDTSAPNVVDSLVKDVYRKWCDQHSDSSFAAVNVAMLGLDSDIPDPQWIFVRDRELYLRPIRFPAFAFIDDRWARHRVALYRNKPIDFVPGLSAQVGSSSFRVATFSEVRPHYHRLGIARSGERVRLCFIWEIDDIPGPTTPKWPTPWGHIDCVSAGRSRHLNVGTKLGQLATVEILEFWQRSEHTWSDEGHVSLAETAADAAAWIILAAERGVAAWGRLLEQKSILARKIWKTAFGDQTTSTCTFLRNMSEMVTISLDPATMKEVKINDPNHSLWHVGDDFLVAIEPNSVDDENDPWY